jgi:hypothetical protein
VRKCDGVCRKIRMPLRKVDRTDMRCRGGSMADRLR